MLADVQMPSRRGTSSRLERFCLMCSERTSGDMRSEVASLVMRAARQAERSITFQRMVLNGLFLPNIRRATMRRTPSLS